MNSFYPSYDMSGWGMNMGLQDPCCYVPEPTTCGCRPMHRPEPEPQTRVYVVRQGDSVYKIARRFGTTMNAIIRLNNLQNPDLIFPGQRLLIPR